jgi:ATP-binding cassette subfamily B (MDR/TAP) protein 1
MQGRTVILIAHRMSTIINADKIVLVENGRVAQSGKHKELLEKSEFYSSICSMQSIVHFFFHIVKCSRIESIMALY